MKERLGLRKALIAIVVVLLVAAVGVGAYLQIYRPSHREILTESTPPMRAEMRAMGMLPVTPLSQLPELDQERFATALQDAVHAIEPNYRIEEERMYLWPGGWDAVRKLSGEYFRNDFGFDQQARATTQVDGKDVDYVTWGSRNWLRRLFDDRIVVAVAYSDSIRQDVRERLLGYFVMRPA
jgi:hypothetical protein